MSRVTGMIVGLAGQGVRGATRVAISVADLCWREAQVAERLSLRVLQQRLELAAPPSGQPATDGELSTSDAMAELLGRAVEESARDGREGLFRWLIADLVPDEARIIATLSRRGRVALVHVNSRLPGGERPRLLENATLLGPRAALAVPDMAHVYVSKLLTLGLVEVGPQDETLEDDYEILLADGTVRGALARGGVGKVPGRAVKRTLALTSLGEELWAACRREP